MRAPDAVRDVERGLAEAGVPEAGTDAEILVAHVLGVPRSAVWAGREPLAPAQVAALRELADRRRRREPLQHLIGEWGFRRLSLRVDARALIPRPETEVVVERCLELVRDLPAPRVLDVGTGSGAIALALADEHPGARVVAADISAEALALAEENAARTGLADRIELVRSDLFDAVSGPFDLVVSNPPYIGEHELASLEPEVREHDPRAALVSPGVTEAIVGAAPQVLRLGGALVLEVGDGQAERIARLLAAGGYRDVAVTPDLGGTPRVVEGRRS